MKKMKIEKCSLIIFLTLLAIIPTVKSLGITGPIPSDLRMMKGDSARFKFQVQAPATSTEILCRLYTEGFDPLIITFDETPVTVDAGTVKNVYGTITIPNNAQIKTYNGIVFAGCAPSVDTEDMSGSIITKDIGAKYSLDVVATETERNIRELFQTIPEEETAVISTSTVITILIIIIAVTAVGVYYWTERVKKKKK